MSAKLDRRQAAKLMLATVMAGGGPRLLAAQNGPAEVVIDGARLLIVIEGGEPDIGRQRLLEWITRCGDIVRGYYGRFPVRQTHMIVRVAAGEGVQSGKVFGDTTTLVRLGIGRASTQRHLDADWKLVHEFVHLACPRLDSRHDWLSEGLAVYVEGIARVQAGFLTPEAVWGEFARDMPKGLPREGDRGLDGTPSWGRRYWGGAIFCLLADVLIRARTDNARGLQHGLRAVARRWSFEVHRDLGEVLGVADAATGVSVLTELYEEMRAKPISPDLDKLWSDLGVRRNGQTVQLDDQAPYAHIRRAIMQPLPEGAG